jgi:hypothetical protein
MTTFKLESSREFDAHRLTDKVRVAVYADQPHMGCVGVLLLEMGHWQEFGAALLLGAERMRGRVKVVCEGDEEVVGANDEDRVGERADRVEGAVGSGVERAAEVRGVRGPGDGEADLLVRDRGLHAEVREHHTPTGRARAEKGGAPMSVMLMGRDEQLKLAEQVRSAALALSDALMSGAGKSTGTAAVDAHRCAIKLVEWLWECGRASRALSGIESVGFGDLVLVDNSDEDLERLIACRDAVRNMGEAHAGLTAGKEVRA